MKNSFYLSLFFCMLLLCRYSFSAPYETLNKNFSRLKSHVMVRKISTPTLANLDCAAYLANPVRYDPQAVKPKKPAKKVSLGALTFNGAILSPCCSLAQTPLSETEKERPLAWDPLQNRLWEITKTDLFGKITAAVNGEKWADPSVFLPYQEIAAVYLHGNGDSASLFVKIEFKPWVKFLDNIPDEDRDGFREIYGRLDLSNVDSAPLAKALEWISSDYTRTVFTKEQTLDWANTLASYWYPKLNTDVVDMTGQTEWPTGDTEKKIRRELKELVVREPAVVIRGNPYGKKIYNVFVVDFPPASSPAVSAPLKDTVLSAAALSGKDSSVSSDFLGNTARFAQELKINGDYPEWAKKDELFRKAVTSFVNTLPKDQLGFAGKDGWLFFRGEIDYLNGGDLASQAKDKNPLPVLKDFKTFLDRHNISLLFCVVPNKSDVYFEKLPVDAPKDPGTAINPYGRKFLADLQKNGIEVLDLLPDFLAAKQEDPKYKEALYQKHDTHWTLRGLQLAAHRIAGRIRHYAWFGDLGKNPVAYSLRDTLCSRLGDIVERIPQGKRPAYPADLIAAQQVRNPDGTLYKASNPDAPVMLIGDSFTGVFELIDCKAAGVGSHIAAATGIPVDIITSWGGGPLVRDKMLRARKNYLAKKKLVVYLMVARDLYNYSQNWLPLETGK
jgi:hypothetical protein